MVTPLELVLKSVGGVTLWQPDIHHILINDISNCYVGVQEMGYLMVYKLLV